MPSVIICRYCGYRFVVGDIDTIGVSCPVCHRGGTDTEGGGDEFLLSHPSGSINEEDG